MFLGYISRDLDSEEGLKTLKAVVQDLQEKQKNEELNKGGNYSPLKDS